ncbi:MAG: hypothetical protein WC549_02140 [Actinomycetota bacterium]
MPKFIKYYVSETAYYVYEKWETGGGRVIDHEKYGPYLKFLIDGGVPDVESGSVFVYILNGRPYVVPNKDEILAAEEAAEKARLKDEQLREELRATDWKVLRHLEQITLAPKDATLKVKLTDKEFEDLLKHRQSLRDQVSDPKIDVSVGG